MPEKLTSKQIAQKVLDLTKEHEASWDEKTSAYRLGRYWDYIEAFLRPQSHSAFALVLDTFGWQYTNDVIDLCREIVEKDLS